ncbi:helix-turn-helix transcriptional regulator [Gallaecimonas sp. GXIMD1310]|uniref:helix-turn-helix transcriptional regulator n=1 Tax=Gallaecimonas sp. GXIMD1310 TaxID=3131926 RepID=UPI003254D03A
MTRILYLLKTQGPQSAQALSAQLGMTAMGARQHLLAAEEQGLVESQMEKRAVGRPARVWRLTETGHARFPERHADLMLTMIDSVRDLFGEAGLEKVVSHREQQMQAVYQQAIDHNAPVAERLATLAKLRSAEGYMAEVETLAPGQWLLVEHHCPICSAAQHCQQFCRSELTLFSHCLGSDVQVSRVEHLLDDGQRCAYRIVQASD